MSILEFPHQEEDVLDLTDMPDVEDMEPETLREYELKIRNAIRQLDQIEPKNENSEEYDEWADDHESLEDILDEILDRLEEIGK